MLDGPLTALFAGFLYYTARRSWASAFAVAVAAGLTRETGLLLVAGLVGSALFARQYRRAVGFATAALPTFGWYAFTAWHVRSPEIPLLLEWPLLGQVRRLFVFREFAVPAWKQLVFQMVDLAAVLGLLASLAIAAWFVWKREVGPVELVAGFYVALGLVLGETGVHDRSLRFCPADFSRVAVCDGHGCSPAALVVFGGAADDDSGHWVVLCDPDVADRNRAVGITRPRPRKHPRGR